MTQSQVESIEPWRERWLEGKTGWDQGKPHSQLRRLLQHAVDEGRLPAGARLFSAGCGRAHSEAWLAEQGYTVDAVDAVPEAIDGAKALYGQNPRLHLRVADVFAEAPGPIYDAVYDRAMLCALQPSHRSAYVQKVSEMLRPGGLFMSIPFRLTRNHPDGPPFMVNEEMAYALLQPGFDLVFAGSCPPLENPQNVLEEWLCLWRKK